MKKLYRRFCPARPGRISRATISTEGMAASILMLRQMYRAFLLTVLMTAGIASNGWAQGSPKIEIAATIGHSNSVNSVAFSPDGNRVLSGSFDTTVKLWDAATGGLIRTFMGHSSLVNSVAFSADGTRIVSGSTDQTIKVWDATTGRVLRTLSGHTSDVLSVAFSPDGARVASGSKDRTVKLWNAATGALIRTIEGHSSTVNSVTFSPDGTQILSAGDDQAVKLWSVATGALVRSFLGHSAGVGSVAFSPDGTKALSSSNDKTIKLWDVVAGSVIRTFMGGGGPVALSPDGTRVVSSSLDEIEIRDALTGALLRTVKDDDFVTSVAFSPDGARVLSGHHDAGPKLRDAATGTLIRAFEGRAAAVSSVAISPDGARLLSGSYDNKLRLWDAASGRLLRNFDGPFVGVEAVAYSPDGTRVLSGNSNPDNTIKMLNAATGALIRTFEGHSGSVRSLTFSPDGTRVLSGSNDQTVKLWDAVTGRLLRTVEHSNWVSSVAFSPDAARLLSGSVDGVLKVWDARTGEPLRTIKVASSATLGMPVAFSPDGRRLLSGGWPAIKLWDAGTGSLIRAMDGHSDLISSVIFSPDGRRVLSGSYDRTVKLWDAATGALLRTFEGHASPVVSVAFSSDGARILTGSLDGTVRIWFAATGEELASMLAGLDGEWLAMTKAGFFAASRNGPELLSVTRGLALISIRQMQQSLFNPDLLREAMAGDPSGEVRDATKVISLDKVFDSGPAPVVAITANAKGSQSRTDLVTIDARVTDKGTGIGRIEWRVNGVTAAVGAQPLRGGPDHHISQTLALDPGDNTIEVVAYNRSNLLASLPARATVKFTASADRTKPKLYILAVGINAYVDKGWTSPATNAVSYFPPLNLAVKDAETFGEDMKRAGAALYKDEPIVIYARDAEATREKLGQKIDALARQIHPRDTFILFAAGHGFSVDGRFYLIPQDYQGGENPQALVRNAIGQDVLQDWLANRIKAKKALVLLDTCRSGALVAGHLRPRTSDVSEAAVGRLHEATGRPVLTAAALSQDALEGFIVRSGVRHGLFTWAVLDALRNGDTNNNGQIELSELVAHVQALVPTLAGELGGSGASPAPVLRQTARFGSRGEDFSLVSRIR